MQLWQDLLATALLGTGQQTLNMSMPAGGLGEAFKHIDWSDQEQALLSVAGLATLWRRAGQLPINGPATLLTVCANDEQPTCIETATSHLKMMLQGDYSKVLPEWLTALRQAGKRVPASCLPELLETGRIKVGLRDLIVPVLGQRGHWLAEQNPDWHYAIKHSDESVWETGTREQRLIFLRGMRHHTPARVRELLNANWSQESAKDRTAFLGVLTTHLDMEDEPFLEQALDDRSKEVRRTAAELLAHLSDSRLVQRLSTSALQLLHFQPSKWPKRDVIQVEAPRADSQNWLRDGIDPKLARSQRDLGERAWLLAQILSAVPPDSWCQQWDRSPYDIVQATRNNEWRQALLIGWARATLRHKDVAWAETLLSELPEDWAEVKGLLNILSHTQREAYIFKLLEQSSVTNGRVLSGLDSVPVWSERLTRTVLMQLRDRIATAKATEWRLRAVLNCLAEHAFPDLADEVASVWPAPSPAWSLWEPAVHEGLALLFFRRDMLAAIQQD
ncbi:MAG: DUF5691 domain-containing protein [Candidatus Competibacteraceae bacterium]|jgi:hypothetical protein|nr:DUF5691 domain-containing protein [Candidatus Competibacteraceae bacterium]